MLGEQFEIIEHANPSKRKRAASYLNNEEDHSKYPNSKLIRNDGNTKKITQCSVKTPFDRHIPSLHAGSVNHISDVTG